MATASASAATYTVNAWNDVTSDGTCTHPWTSNADDCTIRDAIDAANSNPGSDTIVFDTSLRWFDGSSTVTSTTAEVSCAGALDDTNACGDLDAFDSTAGATLTLRGGAIINAIPARDDRTLHAPSTSTGTYPVHLILDEVLISGGRVDRNASAPTEGGGCVATASTDLDLIDSELVGCEIDATIVGYVAGAPGGGAAYVGGDLTVSGSKISQSFSRNRDGAGIDARGRIDIFDSEILDNAVTLNGVGGGLVVRGANQAVTIERTLIKGNTAPLQGGGAWLEPVSLHLVDSELDSNGASLGGGMYLVAFTPSGPIIERSTFFANTSNSGGGLYLQGPPTVTTSQHTLRNTTFSENEYCATGCGGGGIFVSNTGWPTTLVLEHVTFVQNNMFGSGSAKGESVSNLGTPHLVTTVNSIFEGRCPGAVTSGGGNWMDALGDCGHDPLIDEPALGVHPAVAGTRLKPLAYMSPGFTRVYDERGPSRSLNNPKCVAAITSEDQRGAPRPVGAYCDIGAVER